MGETLVSLLDGEANEAQLLLTLGEHGFSSPRIDRSQPRKNYTGAILFRERPEVYRAIVSLGVEPGISKRRICEICHVTRETVDAVLLREPQAVSAHKKQILGTLREVQRSTAERLAELAPSMSAKDATLAMGVTTDKVELLSGGVTARVEVRDGASIVRDFHLLTERIEKAVSARVIEAAALADMRSDDENSGANGSLLAPSERAGEAIDVPITSNNEGHIKSDCLDSETLRPKLPPSHNSHNEIEPAAAVPGGGGIGPPPGGSERHSYSREEIL